MSNSSSDSHMCKPRHGMSFAPNTASSILRRRVECANKTCKRTMRANELVPLNPDAKITDLVCPRCGSRSTYDLAEPVTNDRINECNTLIEMIASTGHKFFSDKSGFVSTLEMSANGRVLFVDYYTRRRVDTHQRRWAGFTSGGTLRDFVAALRDYIKTGKQLDIGLLGLERSDGTFIWGYSKQDIAKLRQQALSLNIFVNPQTV